jgi:uncharacterized NAD(P)/FAD-binding protein YdhS
MRHTIVIVGGGFCGAVLAANLLRRPPSLPADIVLIERRPAIGRGVAYAVRDYGFLLNVPAARLSADSHDPLQFLRFAQRSLPQADAEAFLPRALYGSYIQDTLLQAERSAPGHVRLVRLHGEATRLVGGSDKEPLAVIVANHEPIVADRVILALGNPSPPLLPWARAVENHAAYRHDPWVLPRSLTPEHRVLIVGNGLTTTDVVLALSADAGREPVMHTISRRGLVPERQTEFHPDAIQGDGESLLRCASSTRRLLAASRELTREATASGADWREVVTFIRGLVPALWRRMPEVERRRFLRHLQPHWEVHRHRVPPQIGERIAELRRRGKLRINAGRIQRVEPAGDRLRVSWQPRGTGSITSMTVDALINATGPDYMLERAADPLVKSMLAQGLVCPDNLNLGLRTGAAGACLDAQGSPSERLFYVGPMLRADHMEATAATELRDHIERLAAYLSRD